MSKILLLGGAGYIGTVVSQKLLDEGHEVICYDILGYGHGRAVLGLLQHPRYKFVYADIRDRVILDQHLKEAQDVVIMAGLVGDPITKRFSEASRAINVEAMSELLGRINGKNIRRAVFISTCSNYGLIPDHEVADESYALSPLSLYAEAKVQIEKQILGLQGRVDFTATVLRFATAFGLSPRMRFDLSVNEFTRTLAIGEELRVYDADTWRPYCHTLDFARLIQRVLDADEKIVYFQVFNAGGDENHYTKRQMVNEILKKIPDGKVSFANGKQDPRNYRVNFSKVRERLGFEPAWSVPSGVDEILRAHRAHLFDDAANYKNFYGNYEWADAPQREIVCPI